jgi:hypothetical protein
MSHELKTPLNSVIGFTELSMAVSKESEQREHLAMALSSAKSLLTLIDSILDFARMEAGKLAAISAPFLFDEIMDECADSLAMRAFAKGLDASMSRDPAIPDAVIGDSSLLKHILLNLLDNSVKFTDRGRIRLGARLYEENSNEGEGIVIEFEVSDTGIGMPKDRIGHAFARFTQLDPSRTRRAGGTGLGLAIVAKSVDLMGGKLTVDSEEGIGTRFRVRLPFERAAEPGGENGDAVSRFGREATLVGFDDEGFSDASLVLARLGLSGRRAGGLKAASGGGLVIADERIVPEAGRESISALETRLIIGTRFGGNVRAALEGGLRIAFTPLPLRAAGLRAALASLPSIEREEERPLAGRAAGPDTGSRDEGPAKGELGVLLGLVKAIESAMENGSFAAAERAAKDAQGELSEAGDAAAARLAFSALLNARKADRTGLAEAVAKMRAFAGAMNVSKVEVEGP